MMSMSHAAGRREPRRFLRQDRALRHRAIQNIDRLTASPARLDYAGAVLRDVGRKNRATRASMDCKLESSSETVTMSILRGGVTLELPPAPRPPQ
jgi:hypothetical protein